jgi:hypothetical protein
MSDAQRILSALALLVVLPPAASAQGINCRQLPSSTALPPAECLRDVQGTSGPTVSGPTEKATGWRLVLEDKPASPPVECGEQSGQIELPPAEVAGSSEVIADLVGEDAYMESFPASVVTAPVEEGARAATFDGFGLYVWRLVAGGAVQPGRMTLTR